MQRRQLQKIVPVRVPIKWETGARSVRVMVRAVHSFAAECRGVRKLLSEP